MGKSNSKKWEELTQKNVKVWLENVRRSDSKNEKAWLEKLEGLTRKSEKVWPE